MRIKILSYYVSHKNHVQSFLKYRIWN